MLSAIGKAARRTERRLALGSASGICVLAGFGIWCAAGYVALAPLIGQAAALFVAGSGLLGAGMIGLAIAGRQSESQPPEADDTQQVPEVHIHDAPIAAVMAAFLNGFSQGTAQKQRH